MCVHNISSKSTSDSNKISEYNNLMQTDIEVLNEFSSECCYYDNKKELIVYQNDLSIMHLNIRSILPKQHDLAHLIKDPFVDVCLLNETWLTKQNKNLVNISGYDLISNERDNKKGGGVGILLASYLSYKVRPDLEIQNNLYEICVVELNSNSGNIILVSLYKPPNTNDKTFLKDYKTLISTLKKEKHKRVIIGCDHNFDLLKADHHNGTRNFLDYNIDNGIWPVITKPSWVTKNSATLIDNIFISNESISSYDCGILVDDISDYFPCYLILRNCKVKNKPKRYVTCRKITPKTTRAIRANVSSVGSQLSLVATNNKVDINCTFESCHSILMEQIDRIAPYERIPLKPKYLKKEPWLPTSLLKSIKKQKLLYQVTLKTNCN